MGIMHGTEFLVLILLAIIILGPTQLPEYAAKLARVVVHMRRMANDAKGQLKEQMGPEYEDLNWRQYDPRQYDPRRIVREALLEPLDDAFSLDDPPSGSGSTAVAAGGTAAAWPRQQGVLVGDPGVVTPFDPEAT